MDSSDIQFKDIGFDFEFERIEADDEQKEPVEKKVRRKKSNKDISLDNIKTRKGKKNGKDKVINLDNIQTCKGDKSKSTAGLGTLSVSEPKVQPNSFMGAVVSKTHSEAKANEKELQSIKSNRHPYMKSGGLLTQAEKILYDFLVLNLPNTVTVLIKVRLGDIIKVNEKITRDSKHFYKIACKHIDFLICNKTDLDIICAVELDDFTHDTSDRQARDRFVEEVLYECKIRLIRIKFKIRSIEKADIREIENTVFRHQAPECPVCHVKMGVKMSKWKNNFGHRFYGCINFPNCRENIDID